MRVGEEEWDGEDVEPPVFANPGAPTGPDPSSEAPDQSTEPHPLTGEAPLTEAASDDEESEALPEFDRRFTRDMEGLLYLGKLTKRFHWLGHSFTIQTLSVDDVLEVGLLHQEFVNTVSDVKAYQAAVVAACVVEVDGKPMPIPLLADTSDKGLMDRFLYVRRWFPPTLDAIYEQYLKLEARVSEVIEAMGKAPGWTEASTPTSVGASA